MIIFSKAVLVFTLSLLMFACSGDDTLSAVDGGQPLSDTGASSADASSVDTGPGESQAGQPGTISIYIKGDHESISYNDGLAGQTPFDYEVAVSRYYTLRSANDPQPFLCFDHGQDHAIADIARDNLVGVCDTSKIPSATYTHGRTKVEWSRYSVNGSYHIAGQAIAITMTVFRAYSDTTCDGKSYTAGQGLMTFTGGPTPVEIPLTFPPLPDVPGVSFETIDGEFLMTFAYSRPLQIVQNESETHWARFNWQVKDAYRWVDKDLPGFGAATWDISADMINTELVLLYGVAGYYVTASTDEP